MGFLDSFATAIGNKIKAVKEIADGKSTVSFTQTLSSGTEVGTLTIDGTPTTVYAPDLAGAKIIGSQSKETNSSKIASFTFTNLTTNCLHILVFAGKIMHFYNNPDSSSSYDSSLSNDIKYSLRTVYNVSFSSTSNTAYYGRGPNMVAFIPNKSTLYIKLYSTEGSETITVHCYKLG